MKKGDCSAPDKKPFHKATTPEGREDQLIALAVDLAEERLRDGTASNQIVVHFLNLASRKERLETEVLAEKKKLLVAQTEQIQSEKRTEELTQEALKAFKEYSGSFEEEEEL